MNGYINYLIEANLALMITLLFYQVLLRRETQFDFKRAYLLVGISASLLFPLIKIQAASSTIPSIGELMSTYFLPELVIGEGVESSVTSVFSYWEATMWIYLTVSILLLIRLIVKLSRVLTYLRKSESSLVEGKFKIIEGTTDLPTFSFFHYIFIGNTSVFSLEEKDQIIKHEITHATKLHSVDILLVEFLKIIFWFNPVVYYLKFLFTNIHEFQADQLAVENRDVNQYCNLLARVALQSADYPIANHFNNSLTLKRIAMMKTAKTKLSRWKIAAIATLLVSLFLFTACQDQIGSNLKDTEESTRVDPENYTGQTRKLITKLQLGNPTKSFFVVELTKSDAQKKFEELEAEYKAVFRGVVVEGDNRSFTIFEKGERTQGLSDLTVPAYEVFTLVDEPATPVEGMTAFYTYIASNLVYPEQARKLGIQGKVFVEFTIEKDGSIKDVKSLKGLGAGCDKEAVRIISAAANWNPAKQKGRIVRQRMVLPISFKLG